MPGNDNVIDRLAIEVVGQATSALSDLDTLIDKFSRLKTDISKLPKITGDNFITKAAATNLNDFSTALSKVSMAYLGRFASALTSLATVDTTGLKEVASAMKQLTAIGKISEIDHKPLLRLLSALNDADLSGVANLSEAAKGLRAFNAVATMSKPGSGRNLGQAFATLESVDLGKIHSLAEASSGLSSSFTSIASMSRSADASKLFGSFYVLENVNADKIKALSEASVGLSANFSSIASVSKSGSAEKLQGVFSAIEGANPEKIREIVDASNGLSSNFSSISSMSRNAGDGLKTAFSVLQNVDTEKITKLGAASKSLSNFSSIASILRSGAKGVEEVFAALGNEGNFALLEKLSRIDFSNMRDLADASRVISRLRDRVKELEKTEDKTAQTQEKLAKSTVKVTREARKASSSFNFANTALGKFFNSIKRIAFYRAIRSAIKAVTQGFAEGIENLYYWSQMVGTSFAPRMDQLATATQYLKNGFASMWSPLIEYAIPIIDNLIDRLVDMFNVVQELFARLTGAATWNKALKYPVTYKDALDDAAGSAKALQNILMDFDEINAINTPKSGSRGSGADAKDYSSMFQLMETPTGNSPLGKFGDIFNDVSGKVETAYVSIKKFWDFFKGLNFKPMMDSASGFWDTVSPIIDDIIADADWVRAKVLQPVTKFLVEEGIPGAIDTLGVALDNLWAAFTPIKEGAKDFWDKNGDWILDLTKGQIRTGLDKIKEAFKEIGEFFSKNKSIKKIFDSIGSMAKRLSPVILAIADLVGSDGWQTFVDGVQTILDLLDPILESAAGVFELLDGIVNFDPDKMASGLETILRSITKSMLNPLATVMDLLGRMFDGLSKIAGWFGWDDLEKSFKETADLSRANADEIRKWGDEFSIIGKKADTAHAGITNGNKGAGASFVTLESQARQTYDSIVRNGSSAAQQAANAWYNSTNSTKTAIDSLPTANANAIMRIKEQTASLGQYIKNVLGVDVANFAPSAGYTIGSQLKVGIENGLRNLHLNIPATVNIVNTTGSTAAARVHGATFDMNMFASGGFLPSQYSLFAAGEGGVPEMLGTVGGRTAVAGGAEITGIREAILEQGQREEGLLRSLISAVQNKDLSLVANSATGRWVNKALKAYSGVSG